MQKSIYKYVNQSLLTYQPTYFKIMSIKVMCKCLFFMFKITYTSS